MNEVKEIGSLSSEEIRERLPYGGLNKVIRISRVGRTTVNAIINNISNYTGDADCYSKVVDAIVRVLEEDRKKKEKGYSALSKTLRGEIE